MNKFIPLSVPNLSGKELEYVTKAVKDEWVSTGGAFINQFEENIAKYVGVSDAVACQSGTAGLHLALQLCGVTNEDEVIAPTLTFIAAVNPIRYLGAEPIFMDCDDSLTIDVNKLECFLREECSLQNEKVINKISGKTIKAIVVVHIFGNNADMEKIMELAEEFNLKVVEDATEALGTYYTYGKYEGKYLGTIGDFGVYSFNGNKIITTGGGGLIVSKHEDLLKKAKYLSTQAKDDDIYYIHDDIGYNYRMTNLQAALGVAQLEQLEGFISVKEKNYNLYKRELRKGNEYKIMNFNEDIRPNYWFYSLFLKNGSKERDLLIKDLSKNKIQARPIWGLIHEQKPYKNCQVYKIEKAKYYMDSIVNIPCSSKLSDEEVRYVVKTIKTIL